MIVQRICKPGAWVVLRLLAATVLALGVSFSAQIEPGLIQRLAENRDTTGFRGENGSVPIFRVDFYMTAQANALDLDPSLTGLPKPERRARVGRVLMDFASASQQELLTWLRVKEAEGQVTDISPLWIVNAIGCCATRDVIVAVAQRPDVALIYYDLMPCELGEIDLKARPEACDGIEPAMVVTNVRGAWNQGYHGENVVLGVVDTGVRYTHLDLRDHLWTSPAYPNCGFNFASYQYRTHRSDSGPSPYDTLTPLDYYGHGTHIAGIALADGAWGDGSRDTMGIAPATLLMSLPVDVYLHSPYPDTSMENNTMEGFQFCIRPPRDTLNGADVITTSLGLVSGWLPRYAVWRAMEENVLAAGLPHTIVAGSEGPSARTIRCPACCPPPWPNPANHPTSQASSAVITVGATDNNDNVAPFSSIGPSDMWGNIPPYNDYAYPPGLTDPDVMMPGINIRSTYYTADDAYTDMSGTSMSCPAAAGVVCLMLSRNPALSPREIDSILELYAVRDLGAPGKDNTYGAGRINCSLAVALAAGPVNVGEEILRFAQNDRGVALRLEIRPNPSKGPVEIVFTLGNSQPHSPFSLSIYDAAGRLTRTFNVPASHLLPAAYSSVSWDGRDERGYPVLAGCYFCSLTAGTQIARGRFVLTR
jgi:hypothetical protein